MKKESSWIGVDLDGTLAVDEGKPWGDPKEIGPPIPEMVERVKKWLTDGIEVRIFTARVHEDDLYNRNDHRLAIQDWCRTHIGYTLEVTCKKDHMMWELWDDRVVQVVKNTGQRVGEEYR